MQKETNWIEANMWDYTFSDLYDLYVKEFDNRTQTGLYRRIYDLKALHTPGGLTREADKERTKTGISRGNLSLCWLCQHVAVHCSYGAGTKPVAGWVATPNKESHIVHKCPNYSGVLGEGFNLEI